MKCSFSPAGSSRAIQCWNIGANMGTHAVFFGLGVGPQGTVHCFEPQPPVARLLSANLCLNHLSWCEVHPAGVSDAPGEAWIPRYNYDIVRNYGAVPLDGYNAANRVTAEEMSERVKIPLMTIDSLHLPRVPSWSRLTPREWSFAYCRARSN